jgi:hypothetical protein
MTSLRPPPFARRQRGAVAIVFGLMLAVLIGFAGLAIDLGRFFVIKTELQNAVDACALAAATQLRPGQNNPTALTKAVAYGRVFSTGGVSDPGAALDGNIGVIKNRINFQRMVFDIAPGQITFADTLDGVYQPAGSANPNTAAYARCSFPLTGLPIYFMRVLNPLLGTQTVSAMASATLGASQSACALPVAVCKAPGGNAANLFGLEEGRWLIPPAGKGATYGTGNFGWLDYTPPGGGASELADMLTAQGQCSVEVNDVVGEPGSIASLDVAWNSRFGLYKPGAGNPKAETAPPDATGYTYNLASWPLGANAYQGSVAGQFNYREAAASHRPYQFTPPNPYSRLSNTQHQSFGRSRRLAVAPMVDCGVWNAGGANPRVEGWACVLMLNPLLEKDDQPSVEFLGLSSNPGSPCSTNGEPGMFGPLVPQLVQ